jgi:hypothetical protein
VPVYPVFGRYQFDDAVIGLAIFELNPRIVAMTQINTPGKIDL